VFALFDIKIIGIGLINAESSGAIPKKYLPPRQWRGFDPFWVLSSVLVVIGAEGY
jgi:hypothetical protein